MVSRAIFIVGCARSGTTLLQSLLGCAPSTATFRESHLFSRSLTRKIGPVLPRRPVWPEVQRFWHENELPLDQIPSKPSLLHQFSPSYVADQCRDALIKAAQVRSKDILLEKTPRHLYYIDTISAAFGRLGIPAAFVHIIRDGVSTAASVVQASQHWREPVGPQHALARWHIGLAESRKWYGTPGHYFTTYESLTVAATHVTQSLAGKLSLPLHEDDLALRRQVTAAIVRPDEHWKSPNMDNSIAPSDRTQHHVPTHVIEWLESRTDHTDYDYIRARL